jgi:plasmid stabilization system protein ParE
MALAVVFRRIAQIELDEAVSWYENKRVGVGKKLRIEIEKRLEQIAKPQRFKRIRGHVRRAVSRPFPYSIYFLHEIDSIVVLAIFHARRAPEILEDRF